MKVAQTELSEAEYRLVAAYARKRDMSLKEALREAALKLAIPDKVAPDDPIFVEAPAAKATGKKERTSVEHDKLLYGSGR